MGTGPQNLERAEEGILEEVRKAATEEYSDQDVERARNAYLRRMAMRRLTRISNAYLMGLYELRGEGSDRHNRWIDELRAVATEEVTRVARHYLQSDNMTVAIVR
jgi:predicted Zn-dependent peptidase